MNSFRQLKLLALCLLGLGPLWAQNVTQAPPLTTPPDGQVFINQPPTIDPGVGIALRWSDVANEEGYEIDITFYPEAGGATQSHTRYAAQNAELFALVSLQTGGVTPELGRYVWRVRGYRGSQGAPSQTGPYSEARSFRVVAEFRLLDPPDVFPRAAGDGQIDRRDVLAFATQWYKVSAGDPGGADPFNPRADFDASGRVDELDLLALISYLQGTQPRVILPRVNLTYPDPRLSERPRVLLSAILSGAVQMEAVWDRVPEAFGYVLEIVFGEQGAPQQIKSKFILNPSGPVVSVTTTLNEFLKVALLYNVRVAAVDAAFAQGPWSDYGRFEVLNDGAVTPTPTPNVANRTLDPVQVHFPPAGERLFRDDHRLLPFIWSPATKAGTPIPSNDVNYTVVLGIAQPSAPSGVQVFPLGSRPVVSGTSYLGEGNTGDFQYYWSIRAQQISTGEFSPSLIDPDFSLAAPTPSVPYYSSYHLTSVPVVAIPGNVSRYQFHEPGVYRSIAQATGQVSQDFFAFALAWHDTPAPGKVFAQLADLDGNGLVDARDLLQYVALVRDGNLIPDAKFPSPPQLLGPPDGVARPGNDLDLFLEWTVVPGATRYQVVVFFPHEVPPGQSYPTAEAFIYYAPAHQIQPRMPWKSVDRITGRMVYVRYGEFRWKVRAMDDAGQTSAFSETRRFTVTPPEF